MKKLTILLAALSILGAAAAGLRLNAAASGPPADVARMEPFRSGIGERLENWRGKKGEQPQALKPDFDDSKWEKVGLGHKFQGATCWFRTKFTVPESEKERAIFIAAAADDAGIVYVDGKQLFQFSGSGDALLTESAEAGRAYAIAVRVINTSGDGAFTFAGYKSLADPRLITIENTLSRLAPLTSANFQNVTGWKFTAKGGDKASKPDTDTSDWESVYLPYGIPSDKSYGWYRAEFTLPGTVNGFPIGDGKITLAFSARTSADVYVNGRKVYGFTENGELDLTGKIKPGETVTLAVKVTDLSMRGSLRSVRLHAAALDPIQSKSSELNVSLETARLFLEQVPRPPAEVTGAVEKVAADTEKLLAIKDPAQAEAALDLLIAALAPVVRSLADYPLFHQGPYLQNVKPDGITIMWETLVPAASAVWYGKDGLTEVVSDPQPKTIHEVTIAGLEQETTYRYMAVSGRLAAPESAFTTSIRRDTPFTFVVWGDNRTDPVSHEYVVETMIAARPNIAINVGDVVTHGSDYSQWSREYFIPIRRLAINTPTYIAIGNHEYGGYGYGNRVVWFEKFVSHPAPNDYYFSFTYGNSFFIIVNPQEEAGGFNVRPGSAQYDWLVRQFESDDYKNADFRFIFLHEPPYSAGWSGGYYDGEALLRANLVPLLDKYHVDILFAGHTHDYERGRLPKPGGTYHIITGGGGASLDNTIYKKWEHIDVVEFIYNHSRVFINGKHLKFEAADRNGHIFDSFEINKQ